MALSSLMIGLLMAREPGLGSISRKMRCYEHLDLERGSSVLSSGVFSQDAPGALLLRKAEGLGQDLQ